MARDEFGARNATLSINQQTLSQREKTQDRFNGKGVGSSNDRKLFPNSPIGYDAEHNGLTNRESQLDVYSEYAATIDNNEKVQGFGFSNIDYAHMNYNHPDNPLLENIDALTTGEANSDEVPRRAYRGFPDLSVDQDAINNPSLGQDREPQSSLSLLPDGASYGHETDQYRQKVSESTSTMLGRHVEGQRGNGDSDTLGKYFTKHYTEE